ncbi:unnamed protein product [Protopolystoma xenopodis]|uniref:Uncharacterized protein n=1 Tax=Protopolystoma xenopodis TaxID=117903 RepID=A0A448X9P9_9PLAT|nr:unnamed protein product [Protopolystoma xenopodis]
MYIGRVSPVEPFPQQIKGRKYSLDQFLGPVGYQKSLNPSSPNKKIKSGEPELYQCVIYLSPADYHGIHVPAKWRPSIRRHFPGANLAFSWP